MSKYSIFSLIKNALTYHENWQKAWRDPQPKEKYDAIIVGGGGHGLGTAYYLAKKYGLKNIAVLEKGWIGGGNTGRNTTIIRSNYLWDESAALYEHSVKLFEGLSQELNYNIMFSQRGLFHLAHSVHDLQEIARRGYSNFHNGVDAEFLTSEQVKKYVPIINISGRYPILGAILQRRGGVARHDALAWGFARGADSLGVDIIQNCEVTGMIIEQGKIQGVETSKGKIRSHKIGLVPAGHCSVLANMAGFRLPVQSNPLQALVSEPIKPVLDVVTMSNAVHVYVSQSDKGELVVGAGSDMYNSYSQRGSYDVIDHIMGPLVELYPIFSKLKMLRQWAGIVDVTPDRSPIIGKTSIEGLFINCGWGTGGWKATPGSADVFAETMIRGEPSKMAEPFSLDRFRTGALIDEAAAAAVAH